MSSTTSLLDDEHPLPEPRQRRWYQKKRFIIPIAFFVLLGIAGSLTEDDDADPDDGVAEPTTTTLSGAQGSSTEPPETSPATTSTSAAPTTSVASVATIDPSLYELSEIAFRVDCEDGSQSHIVPDSYTPQEAIDVFCSVDGVQPGVGTTLETPGWFALFCTESPGRFGNFKADVSIEDAYEEACR